MSYLKLFAGTVFVLVPLAAQPKATPRVFPQPAAAKNVTISAIPGVIAAGAEWKIIWEGSHTADGIVGYQGGLLFAQEQTNHIDMLDKNDKFSVHLLAHGPGAIGIGADGRIYVVERTCTDPGGHLGIKPDQCTEPTDVAVLTPKRKVLANSFQGKDLGRVNDLVVSSKGDIYFTSGGVFHVSPSGKVSSIGENLRPNGIMLSPDGKTLYVTNGPTITAFDVESNGMVKNQREFGKLEGGGNGDGMAIDAAGRLYVTSGPGIQVLSPQGKYLGLIPTPRAAISVAFSGPQKKTLYVACLGALGPDGAEVRTQPGIRNTAMSLYKVPMLAQGVEGRAK
jgi:gluconolactonase